MAVKDLRRSPTMSHLLEALERGEDIGHYGRLTFAMAAHHFMEKEELVSSWWEPSQAGPARRTYVLTDRGTKALDNSVSALRDIRAILVNVLDRYDGLSPRAAAH